MEQVRRAANVFVEAMSFRPKERHQAFENEIVKQKYYAHRNAVASQSHSKNRIEQLKKLKIDPNKIKSVTAKPKS